MNDLRETITQLLNVFSYKDIVFELNRVAEDIYNHHSRNYYEMMSMYTMTPPTENCVDLTEEQSSCILTPELINEIMSVPEPESTDKKMDIIVPTKKQKKEVHDEGQMVKVEKAGAQPPKKIKKKRKTPVPDNKQ